MNNDFPRIMTLLRKEKGISQKKAAENLGISQALLSHYEKGIRECGLDFLVRCSKYYNVSCDYLLGLSPQRNGNVISAEEIPDAQTEPNKMSGIKSGSLMAGLNKKLLQNSIVVLFEFLSRSGSKALVGDATDYLFLSIYDIFRIIYSANPSNNVEIFKIPAQSFSAFSSAEAMVLKARMSAVVSDKKQVTKLNEIPITTQSLSREFPMYASSLLNLIQNAENKIKTIK